MADAQSNIRINVDTSIGIAEIKNLQRQIAELNAQLLQSGAQQARAAQNVQRNLINNINATGKFAANVKTISSTAESFTTALERNKLSMGEYFRYAGASTKTFGRLFKSEFDTIQKVAESRVRTLQTQFIKLGRDGSGALKAIAVRPLALDMENLSTKTAIAAQKQQLFNQLVKQGSTNLLNFGKNTQWAGRQLMVGFTIPLSIFATTAVKAFMQMEEQAIRFKRVYGDTFTATEETDRMIEQVKQLANEFTKYGVQVEKTMAMAADAAAMGLMNADLLAQVNQATRLSVLGGVEQEQALETTISLMNSFGTTANELAGEIAFLNAVENQTVTAIEDLTVAIPKAAPVIKQLGGNVQDLAFFLTAMKEGGINASEGANALKSGLASLINPTEKASQFLQGFGINLKQIVEANKGDIKGTVIAFAQALDTLDPLSRARAIEQLFGKFQFARLSTLFQNVIKQGTQAERVLQLTRASSEELAILAERELRRVEESPMFKFRKAVEDIKVSLVPLGEAFLKAITPVAEFAKTFLDRFNSMSDEAKNFAVIATTVVAGIGPILLMTFGLIANGVANLIKMFSAISNIFRGTGASSTQLGMSTEYMTQQQLEAAAVAASLDQSHSKLIQTFGIETRAVDNLAAAYGRAIVAQSRLLGKPVGKNTPKTPGMKLAKGIVSVPGPKGAGDIVPAMLSPGEAVIPARQSQKYAGLIQGMINDNIPGFRFGFNPFAMLLRNSRVATRMKSKDLVSMLGTKDLKYKSAFQTGTGDDLINRISGMKKPGQMRTRAEMERDLLGISENAAPSSRPTYGSLELTPIGRILSRLLGLRGKQFRSIASPNNKNLDIYGDATLIGKRGLNKRSTIFAGDLLRQYAWGFGKNNKTNLPPMIGASRSQLENNARFWQFGYPFGKNIPGKKTATGQMFTANPGSPYIEAQVAGGFNLKEISKIRVPDRSQARQLQKLVDGAGLKIKVTPQNAPIIVRALSSILGTRFNEGVTLDRQSSQERQIREIIRTLKEKLRSAPPAIATSKEATGLTYGSLSKEDAIIAKALKEEILKETPGISQDKLNAKLKNMLGTDLAHLAKSERVETIAGQQFKVKNWDISNLRKEHRSINQLFQHMADAGSPRGSFLPSLDAKAISAKYNIPLATVQKELPLLVNGVHPSNENAYRVYGAIAREYGKPNGKAVAKLIDFRLSDKSAGSYIKAMSEDRLSIKASNDLNQRALRSQQTRIRTAESRIFGITDGKNIPFSLMANDIGTSRTTRIPKVAAKQTTAKKTQAAGNVVDMSTILAGGKKSAPAMRGGRGGLFGLIAKLFGFRFNSGVVSVPGQKGKGDVVPAMLSPGEAVIPTKMAEKYAPLINGMISNSIPGYENGLPAYQDASGRWRDSSGRFAKPPQQQAVGMAQRGSVGMGRAGGAAGLASGASWMYSMGGGPGADIAGQLTMPLMAMSMILPALGSKIGLIVAGLAAVTGAFVLLNNRLNDATKSGIETAKSITMTKEKLDEISEFSGRVTASQIAERRRQGQLSPEDVKKRQFGQSFLESEPGKAMLETARSQISAGNINVGESLANQLAYAVIEGALDQSEAAGIAAAISAELKDQSITSQVTGRLTALFGPNGENLLTDPLSIAIKIQQDSTQAQTAAYENAIQKIEDNAAVDGGTIGNIIGGGIMTAIGLAITPTGVLAPLGAALTAAGIATMVGGTANELFADQAENAEAAAVVVQLGAEQLSQNQGLLDSVEQRYNSQIAELEAKKATAKTDKEILDIENQIATKQTQKTTALDKIKQSNSEIYNNLIKQAQALGPAFNDSIVKVIDQRFEGASEGLKAAANLAKSSLEGMQDGDFKIALQVGLAAGELDPITITNLINANKESNGVIESKFKLLVKAQGTAEANQLIQLLGMAGVKTTEYPVIFDYVMNNEADFRTDLEAIRQISSMTTEYGIEFDVNEQSLETVSTFLTNTEKLPDTVTKQVITDYLAQYPNMDETTKGTLKSILANWDQLSGGQNQISYGVLVDFAVGKTDPAAIMGMYLAANPGKTPKFTGSIDALERQKSSLVDDAMAWFASMAGTAGTKGGAGGTTTPTPTGGAGGTDPIKNILERLKQVRDASIDAAGGASKLLNILGAGKDIKVFSGLEQQLSRFGKEFASFVSGLDTNTRKKFIRIGKDGVVALTKVGQAARKAFIEASLGEFQLNLVQSIQHMENQQRALEILEERGVQYADAIAIATDETLALAIATGAISTEELERIIALVTQLRTGQERATALDNLREQINDFTREMQAKKEIKLKYSPLEQAAILNDDTLMALAKLGEYGSKEFATRLAQVMSTIEFKESVFQDGFNKAMEAFEAQEVQIELDFAMGTNLSGDNPALINLTKLNEQFNAAQNNVDIINFKIDDLEAGIKDIEDQEEVINETYDKRLEALDEVAKNNDRILQQQKAQLTVADALSRGDIAAAARAVQDMRAQEARQASEDAKALLEKSREQALANITNSQGLTRIQLEKQIKDLKDQIFAIEEKTLEPIAEQIRQAEYVKSLRIAEVTVLGKTRLEWEAIKNRIDIARTSSEAYAQAMQAALDIVQAIVDYWNGLDSKEITLTIIENRQAGAQPEITPSPTPSPTGGVTTPRPTGGVTTPRPTGGVTTPGPILVVTTPKPITTKPTTTKPGVPLPGTGVVIYPTTRPTSGSVLPGTGQIIPTTTRPSSGTVLPGTGIIIGTTPRPATTAKPTLPIVVMPPVMTTPRPAIATTRPAPSRFAGGGMVRGYRMGGLIPYKASGGLFKSINTDTVPAMLTPGEFVVRRFAVEKFGADNLNAVNNGTFSGESVYNYSVNVSVQTDANPDQIARAVMSQIKQIDSQRIRGNRF